ncbi:MORN repeat-containing protein [Nitzschia inconspicua]|uniref:MORN repeat-containing protein n=1 Tax=Nitzschia inconspicua TaxID=303405 RepID=A0A9K3L9S5_9STRA|nr:MORN repeat-containing protein [Nitzschia inconspicua]
MPHTSLPAREFPKTSMSTDHEDRSDDEPYNLSSNEDTRRLIEQMQSSRAIFNQHHGHSFQVTSFVLNPFHTCAGCGERLTTSLWASTLPLQCAACGLYSHRSCAFSNTLHWNEKCSVNFQKYTNERNPIHLDEPQREDRLTLVSTSAALGDDQRRNSDREILQDASPAGWGDHALSIFRSTWQAPLLGPHEDEKMKIRCMRSEDSILDERLRQIKRTDSTRTKANFPFLSAVQLFQENQDTVEREPNRYDSADAWTAIGNIKKSRTWNEPLEYDVATTADSDCRQSRDPRVQLEEDVSPAPTPKHDLSAEFNEFLWTHSGPTPHWCNDNAIAQITMQSRKMKEDDEEEEKEIQEPLHLASGFRIVSQVLQENITATFGRLVMKEERVNSRGDAIVESSPSLEKDHFATKHESHESKEQQDVRLLLENSHSMENILVDRKRLGIGYIAGGVAGGLAGLVLAGPAGGLIGMKFGQLGAIGMLLEGSFAVGALAGGVAAGQNIGKHFDDKLQSRVLALGEGTDRRVLLLIRPSIEPPDKAWTEIYRSVRSTHSCGGGGSFVQRLLPNEAQAVKRERYEREIDIVEVAECELPTTDKVLLLVLRLLNNKDSLPGQVYRHMIDAFRNRATHEGNTGNDSDLSKADASTSFDTSRARKDSSVIASADAWRRKKQNNGEWSKMRRQDTHAIIKYITASLLEARPGFGCSSSMTEMTATAVESLVFGEVYELVMGEIMEETEVLDDSLIRKIQDFEIQQNVVLKNAGAVSFTSGFSEAMVSQRAVNALRSLPEAHSAVDKLRHCVRFLEEISDHCSTSDGHALGADSLLPLVCRHIVAAKVPTLNAEVSFLEEFARDEQLLRGREGYAFVTLQAALHYLNSSNNFEADIFWEETSVGKLLIYDVLPSLPPFYTSQEQSILAHLNMTEDEEIKLALGIDSEGNCFRHPNVQVMTGDSPEHDVAFQVCEVCQSELATGGLKLQRKSMDYSMQAVQELQQDKRRLDDFKLNWKESITIHPENSMKEDCDAENAAKVVDATKDTESTGEDIVDSQVCEHCDKHDSIAMLPMNLKVLVRHALLRGSQVQRWLLIEKTEEIEGLKKQLQGVMIENVALKKQMEDQKASFEEKIKKQEKTINQELKMIKSIASQRAVSRATKSHPSSEGETGMHQSHSSLMQSSTASLSVSLSSHEAPPQLPIRQASEREGAAERSPISLEKKLSIKSGPKDSPKLPIRQTSNQLQSTTNDTTRTKVSPRNVQRKVSERSHPPSCPQRQISEDLRFDIHADEHRVSHNSEAKTNGILHAMQRSDVAKVATPASDGTMSSIKNGNPPNGAPAQNTENYNESAGSQEISFVPTDSERIVRTTSVAEATGSLKNESQEIEFDASAAFGGSKSSTTKSFDAKEQLLLEASKALGNVVPTPSQRHRKTTSSRDSTDGSSETPKEIKFDGFITTTNDRKLPADAIVNPVKEKSDEQILEEKIFGKAAVASAEDEEDDEYDYFALPLELPVNSERYLDCTRDTMNLSPVSALTSTSYLFDTGLGADAEESVVEPKKGLQNAPFAKRLPMEENFDSDDDTKTDRSDKHIMVPKKTPVSNSTFHKPTPGRTTKKVTRVEHQVVHDKYGDGGIYSGYVSIKDRLPHGKGKMIYDNGREYEGDWKGGRWHGFGMWKNPNGDYYEGKFVYDARHGSGVYRWRNGNEYQGDFHEDKRQGKGIFNFANGNVYEGDFVNGIFEGKGRYKFEGGYYEGDWACGRYHGKGILSFADGSSYCGGFDNGVANGEGKETASNGTVRVGIWENGRLT